MRLLLSVLLWCLVGCGPGAPLAGNAPTRQLDLWDFFERFQVHDALAKRSNFAAFDGHVPSARRAEALARLWHMGTGRAQDNVRSTVLAYLLDEGRKQPLSDRLWRILLQAARDGTRAHRHMILYLAAQRDTPPMRALLESFLGDDDDRLRESAVRQLSRKHRTRPLLESYIRKHQADRTRARSVAIARLLLHNNLLHRR